MWKLRSRQFQMIIQDFQAFDFHRISFAVEAPPVFQLSHMGDPVASDIVIFIETCVFYEGKLDRFLRTIFENHFVFIVIQVWHWSCFHHMGQLTDRGVLGAGNLQTKFKNVVKKRLHGALRKTSRKGRLFNERTLRSPLSVLCTLSYILFLPAPQFLYF